jgi:hypothetical protein
VFALFDEETGEPNDLSDADEITFAVRREGRSSPNITLTLGNGITLIDHDTDGAFQVELTLDQMRSLRPSETYEVGITIRLQGETVQLFAGTWPIIDGVVS